MDSKESYRSLIRCIGWFGLIIPKLRNITQVVRILPPPRAWIHTRLGHAKPRYFADPARLETRLDFGCATRNTTPQAPCTELHGRYRTPKQLARNAKNPGKTRVLQRRGQEPNFWVFSQWFWGVREVVFRSKVIENEEIRSTTASPRRA